MSASIFQLAELCKIIRYYILASTTQAGSGHPTSSLSAVELMTTLFFGGILHADLDDPQNPLNDRIIFSKGHAAPLLYSLYTAAGKIPFEELLQLRTFNSPLEGHPTMRFPYTEAPTGSLGQGLSVGVGMALNAQHFDKSNARTFVLLGDSEMSEGSNWEAMMVASHYKLSSLIGIIDVNGLGQRGVPMGEHDLDWYQKKVSAFGWRTIVIEGHDLNAIVAAYETALTPSDQPTMIIAKTVKGKGVSFLDGQNNWHGKALNKEEFERALHELGVIDEGLRGEMAKPEAVIQSQPLTKTDSTEISFSQLQSPISVRETIGQTLTALGQSEQRLVVLDAEVSNSTKMDQFKKTFPDRFLEMFIAEQNMVGVGVGLARRGKFPVISTFAAFLTRAFDQIRMAQYAHIPLLFIGSHPGVSIGADGTSQMGLEDMAMFNSLLSSVILYPGDGVSAQKITAAAVAQMADKKSNSAITYLRSTREELPLLYQSEVEFHIGGSHTLSISNDDAVTIVAAGITVYEALKAADALAQQNINVRVIDAYSIRPIDVETLKKAASETRAIITVEDHGARGGLGDSVRAALSEKLTVPIYSLSVTKEPHSGTRQELLHYEKIDADAITSLVTKIAGEI